ncbi:MAG: SWF/SNF helicase family protein [Erysipelotrichaceae bacterium]|nr:SWF/SNF helicase family protein [Erysipelotrichaceae bacterium]
MLEKELSLQNIKYYTLTGSISKNKRKELVDRFQSKDDNTDVFLISLKAGGTGLNLTAASAVIHYDPWWNISAQNQATDRAYRIGQNEKVQVFYMVMKDSIEEKIVQMQKQKKELSDTFIEDNSINISQMSKEEILELFS